METTEDGRTSAPRDWDDFLESRPDFPTIMWKWLRLTDHLVARTPIDEVDDLGFLIRLFISASIGDLNDVLTLFHAKSRSGGAKLLRSIYERTVTMKYLARNPSEVPKFIGYQSIDWQQVIAECETKLSIKLSIPNLKIAAETARREYRGDPCPACGLRKQINWTPKSVKELARSVELEHMHAHAYVFPSKSMHPTFYGLIDSLKSQTPIYNVLNCTHELMVENVAVHRRHFARDERSAPMIRSAIRDFLTIWTFSETSFGDLLTKRREGVYTLPFKEPLP